MASTKSGLTLAAIHDTVNDLSVMIIRLHEKYTEHYGGHEIERPTDAFQVEIVYTLLANLGDTILREICPSDVTAGALSITTYHKYLEEVDNFISITKPTANISSSNAYSQSWGALRDLRQSYA